MVQFENCILFEELAKCEISRFNGIISVIGQIMLSDSLSFQTLQRVIQGSMIFCKLMAIIMYVQSFWEEEAAKTVTLECE